MLGTLVTALRSCYTWKRKLDSNIGSEARVIRRLRSRLARLLVGPFVPIPEEKGVWIVMRPADGRWLVMYRAEKFRLKMRTNLPSFEDAESMEFTRSHTTGRFVGTVRTW